MVYDRDIPDYADVMSLEDWVKQTAPGWMISDDDGSAHPIKNGKMSRTYVLPSKRGSDLEDADSVAWFNK